MTSRFLRDPALYRSGGEFHHVCRLWVNIACTAQKIQTPLSDMLYRHGGLTIQIS